MYQMFEILEVKIFESICAKAVHVEHYRIEMLDTGNVFPMVLEYVEDYQSKNNLQPVSKLIKTITKMYSKQYGQLQLKNI